MTFQERYKYNPETDWIGKGGLTRVYRATDLVLERDVAIKVFRPKIEGQYSEIEDIKKVIWLNHPNLLRYYDVVMVQYTSAFRDSELLQIGIMELANAGNLQSFAREYPNSPILFGLLKQVLYGLHYLHKKGIIYQNLGPQNILLMEEEGELIAKIADYGISRDLIIREDFIIPIVIPRYMTPEQIYAEKYGINGKIGTNSDLWSFGVMVYELITDRPLFGNPGTPTEQVMAAILADELPSDVENLPELYNALVKICLVKYARKRIQTVAELLEILEGVKPMPVAHPKSSVNFTLLVFILGLFLGAVLVYFLL